MFQKGFSKILVIVIVLAVISGGVLVSSLVTAAMDPSRKECLQRGYEFELINSTPSCVFPDNSICSLQDFNQGACGIQFKIDDYCVEKGGFVWDKDKCCPGLRPFITPKTVGQKTC